MQIPLFSLWIFQQKSFMPKELLSPLTDYNLILEQYLYK